MTWCQDCFLNFLKLHHLAKFTSVSFRNYPSTLVIPPINACCVAQRIITLCLRLEVGRFEYFLQKQKYIALNGCYKRKHRRECGGVLFEQDQQVSLLSVEGSIRDAQMSFRISDSGWIFAVGRKKKKR